MLNRYASLFFGLFVILMLTACGGSGGGGGTTATSDSGSSSYTVNDMAQMIEDELSTMEGNETRAFIGTSTYTLDLLGAVLCLPDDPYILPQPHPDPLNLYGCENNLTVTYNGNHAGLQVTFDMAVPLLYLDLETWTSLSNTYPGYSTASVNATITFALIANADGSYALDPTVEPVVDLALADITLTSQDPYVDTISALLLNFLSTEAKQAVTTAIQAHLALVQNTLATVDFFF